MSGLDTKSAMLPDVHKVNRSCERCLSANKKHMYRVANVPSRKRISESDSLFDFRIPLKASRLFSFVQVIRMSSTSATMSGIREMNVTIWFCKRMRVGRGLTATYDWQSVRASCQSRGRRKSYFRPTELVTLSTARHPNGGKFSPETSYPNSA